MLTYAMLLTRDRPGRTPGTTRAPRHRPVALVVDDDPTVMALLVDILEMSGWTAFRARDGERALLAIGRCCACSGRLSGAARARVSCW
jgi:hypothetical protein